MGVAAVSSDNTPLLLTQSAASHPVKRTGTVWTAVAHIVTGVIGSGVLSLAWSIAQLGWVAGPLSMLLLASITVLSSFFLCDTYLSPDPEYGPHRSPSYLDAVNLHLGVRNGRLCGLLVNISLYGFGIAYVITSAISIRSIQNSICYHNKGHEAACEFVDTRYYMLLFGAIEIVLSQIPNFHNIKWLSVLAAIMSFAYSFIGMELSIVKTIENGHAEGSIEGISTSSGTEKLWLVAQALGDISFSYPFSTIIMEIQVYSQPIFAIVENWFHFKFPDSEFVIHTYILKLPLLPAFELNYLRLSFRTAYVASTTVIAMIFPYFNQILGVLGSIIFWPLTIYFPVEMYLSLSGTEAWTAKWVMLRTFSIFGSLLGLFTLVGSVRGIITEKIS